MVDSAPLIAHVIFRLDVGGLENGLVNMINSLPRERFRHAIVCIDNYTEFARRINRQDIDIVAIRKRPGTDVTALWRLYKTFRRLRPHIVHTRNLAALDALMPAWLAGVRCRIHSEHGWDVNDLEGKNRKLRLLRWLHAPLVHRYIALSDHIRNYLVNSVGIPAKKVAQIYNGVDIERFRTRDAKAGGAALPAEFRNGARVVFGFVGRLQAVKDPLCLLEAFAALVERYDDDSGARLAVVGDGPLRNEVETRARELDIVNLTWIPGVRNDVASILRQIDVFVMPSLAEGISNTILEAMASGLPVIACNVGGNAELIENEKTGILIDAGSRLQLCEAMARYLQDPELRHSHGAAARQTATRKFSLPLMTDRYAAIYATMLQQFAINNPDRSGDKNSEGRR